MFGPVRPTSRAPRLSAILLLAGFLALRSVASAQAQPATAAATSTVPALFAGELDDVGPQYLLVAPPRPRRWELWADLQVTGTSNVTLVETAPTASTLTVAQAGVNRRSDGRNRWGGQLQWEMGANSQAYRYGYLTGTKQVVNLVEIDRNDFDLIGLYARLRWQRGPWFAALASRASRLRSDATNRVFYQEAAAEWTLFWQKPLSGNRTLALGTDGAGRFTNTDSFGLLATNWNNRVETGLAATFDQPLGAAGQWHLQPAARIQLSHYTAATRHRTDLSSSVRLTLSRPWSSHAEIRLTVGYDRRDSSDPTITDFTKYDGSIGLGGHWTF